MESKRIAFFSIPAHGHTNPMLPVAAELVSRGHTVRFYSFSQFEEKIKATGAEYVSCDAFMTKLSQKQENALKKVSTTEMTIQDIRMTVKMDSFFDEEFKTFQPDVVYCDSVCFWGKLAARKYGVPAVVSTSTFAFNQLSSGYMKPSFAEALDMIFGLFRIGKELKTLEPLGYKVKSALSLVQSDNRTESVVYTTKRFQPYSESFSDLYAFVGPSVFEKTEPRKEKDRPRIYVSLGTVLNGRPAFYKNCAEALKDINADVVISYGSGAMPEDLPENVRAYPYVDQLDILSKADAFITHCGMNSVSEALYMATPMALFPQTSEERAVAKRVFELGAGAYLKGETAKDIRAAVLDILSNKEYAKKASEMSGDFRASMGAVGAADFIEGAPHKTDGADPLKEVNKACGRFRIVYWAVAAGLLAAAFFLFGKYAWIAGAAAGLLSAPAGGAAQKRAYRSVIKKLR
ncbi:MAG: glycosyl transferase [Clostridia bacterium]|nr:glycosyl transferase [Clostridia bacterium]